MSTVHVLPLHDAVAHEVPGGLDGHGNDAPDGWLVLEADEDAIDVDCVCRPTPTLIEDLTGADDWLVVHHSLDGRELTEPAAA